METIFTERHNLRNSKTELFGGQLVEPFERPSRAEYIIGRVREVELGPISEPDDFGMKPILAIQFAFGVILASWFPIQVDANQGPRRARLYF